MSGKGRIADLGRCIRIEKRLRLRIADIYRDAERAFYTADQINDAMRRYVYEDDEYKRSPRWLHSYLQGFHDALDGVHWNLLCYSYEIDGVRMLITSDEYKAVSKQEVSEKWSHTGAFAYRADASKLFTGPRDVYV